MKRAPIRDILWLFTGTRLVLLMVTYFAYILLTAPKYSSTPVDTVALFSSWNHWDAANYLRIAQFGYNQHPYDLAFFPFFPLLLAAVAYPLGGGWSYLLAGTLISNAALLGALFVIYQLAVDIGGDQVARRTLLYLCIFPTAFYFFAAYNESLLILLTAGSFLAMRRQKWWLAGVLGLLASLIRSAGLLFVILYFIDLWLSRSRITAQRQNLVPIVLLLYYLLSPGLAKTDVLLSKQRFVLEMFPAFITLAMLGIKYPRLHQALMLVFPALLATLSVLFIMNRWMV